LFYHFFFGAIYHFTLVLNESSQLGGGICDRNLASVPKPIEVVKYRSHKDCF